MKLLLIIAPLTFSALSYAECPALQGRYNKCFSEVRAIKGEYIVDQYQESNYEVYDIEYNDDETGESRKEQFKTNNQVISRKEVLPRINVKVRIEGKAHCESNAVKSNADVYFLGAKVGSFTSSIFREGKILKSNIDGAYLGTDVHKRIVCSLEE